MLAMEENNNQVDGTGEGQARVITRHYVRILLIFIFSFFVLGAVFSFFKIDLMGRSASGNSILPIVPRTLLDQKKVGNYQAALQEYESIIADRQKSADALALARVSHASTEFKLTGDITHLLQDVRDLKKIVMNTQIDKRIRAISMNKLSEAYDASGRDPLVFQELFKSDAVLADYHVPNNPDLSARALAEASYGLSPNSAAAIRIARWYSEQPLFVTTLSKEESEEYIAKAIKYLALADKISIEEASANPLFGESPLYISYMHWRTILYGRLAVLGVEPYPQLYAAEYDKAIAFFQNHPDVVAQGWLHYTRLFYAYHTSRIDPTNPSIPREQLKQLAVDVRAATAPETSAFIRFMRNTRALGQTDPTWHQWVILKKMMALSPEFTAAMDAIAPAKK